MSKMSAWSKDAATLRDNGGKIIRYTAPGNPNVIESRKEPIPHANGVGFWYHTSYFLIRPDGTEYEFNTMNAARLAAEKEHGNEV